MKLKYFSADLLKLKFNGYLINEKAIKSIIIKDVSRNIYTLEA